MSPDPSRSAATSEGPERGLVDHHAQHHQRCLELVQLRQHGLVLVARLEIGIARLDDAGQHRADAVTRSHDEEWLRHQALVVHRQRGGPPVGGIGHAPGEATAGRRIKVAERIGRVQPVGAQECSDLVTVGDLACPDLEALRHRHDAVELSR